MNIRIAGTLTREHKSKIAGEVTDTLKRITHKSMSYTHIVFDKLQVENWAITVKLLDK